jgi:PhzF family phenazine biosynthesis protein
MEIPLYQIDAFTDHVFGGNPAAVCPLGEWIDDGLMQSIAEENNLSETAFFVKKGAQYEIRWFTPRVEIELAGHPTLAAAYVIFNYLDRKANRISFSSKSGELVVTREGDLIRMNFPAMEPVETDNNELLNRALGLKPWSFTARGTTWPSTARRTRYCPSSPISGCSGNWTAWA